MKTLFAFAFLGASLGAFAATTAPANTGHFDGLGNDINWTVSKNGGAATTIGAPSYGGYYNGSPFTSASAWIGLQALPTDTFLYSTTFNIEAADVASYRLSGAFSSDNASKLFLNGVDTGVNAPYGNGGSVPGDSYLQPFSFNLSSGFHAGLNTIAFEVTNDAASVSGGWANPDPNGLRAEMQAVPEPASVAALAVGAMGILRRRRKA